MNKFSVSMKIIYLYITKWNRTRIELWEHEAISAFLIQFKLSLPKSLSASFILNVLAVVGEWVCLEMIIVI